MTAGKYRIKTVGKDGVFDSMRKSMWWFHRAARHEVVDGVRVPCEKHVQGKWEFNKRKGTKCPEAGVPQLYQHDGARPHTALVNQRVFASHGKMKQFNLHVVVQPAQRPDLNVDDLDFFRSLQSDVSLVVKQNRRDLLNAVEECWKAYLAEKMNSVWSCPYTSFNGVLESGGDNNYPCHRGFRAAAANDGDSQLQHVARRVIRTAEKHLAELQRIVANTDTSQESSENEVTSSDESD